ncbi:MAG: acyl-CoA dehydrogenase family protein [Thermodesulfobacteriota bacterium]|nr:acyl-CoA dehydrogenase family protein [Thermodesulfobacteriota bacterium]
MERGRGKRPQNRGLRDQVFATEMAFRVLDRSIQIHGDIGLSKDFPLVRWFREISVLRIGEGPS